MDFEQVAYSRQPVHMLELPMCNLYSQRKPREELRGLFKVGHNRAVEGGAAGFHLPRLHGAGSAPGRGR